MPPVLPEGDARACMCAIYTLMRTEKMRARRKKRADLIALLIQKVKSGGRLIDDWLTGFDW